MQEDSNQGIHIKAFKVILVGAQSVGKSSILSRVSGSKFNDSYTPTIGIDFQSYSFESGNKVYSLQIWDTAGQQKFRALTASYYKGAHGCVCVFDIEDLNTLNSCEYYINKALQENIPKECIYLIANKNDIGSTFATEGRAFADKLEINFCEGSAKTGEGLTEAFNSLGGKMVGHFGGDARSDAQTLKPKVFITEKQKCKC